MAAPLVLSSLEQLPLEILQEVAAYLNIYPDSLRSFSRVSSICRSAAEPYLFQECVLRSSYRGSGNRHQLYDDIQGAQQILQCRDRFRHVQSLRIVRYWEPPKNCNNTDRMMYQSIKEDLKRQREEHQFLWMGDFEPKGRAVERDWKQFQCEALHIRTWRLVADLIDAMPALKLFEFDVAYEFPVLLLEHLNNKRGCRLHIRDFRLSQPELGLTEHEVLLAKSPCLNAIDVHTAEQDTNGQWCFSNEAAQELSSGLCPSLRHVTVSVNRVVAGRKRRRPNQSSEKPTWSGLTDVERCSEKGTLRSLTLNCSRGGEQSIPAWIRKINTETLSTLRIYCHERLLPELDWMKREVHPFPSLKEFTMVVFWSIYRETDNMSEVGKQRTTEVAGFLESFQGLQALKLDLFAMTPHLLSAVGRHSSTLRYLSLEYGYEAKFDPQPHILELLEKTLSLESLHLTLFSRLDSDEGPQSRSCICSALCRLPRLEALVLTIHNLCYEGINPKRGDRHAGFARSYWETMIRARGKDHGHVGWPLFLFECCVQGPRATYRSRRDWFDFAGVQEEIDRSRSYPPH